MIKCNMNVNLIALCTSQPGAASILVNWSLNKVGKFHLFNN